MMHASSRFEVFIEKYEKIFLAVALLFLVVYSFSTLTTKPRTWIDEGVTINVANSYRVYGKLDVETAPGVLTGFPQILQSTGFPVTIPLAALFSFTGENLPAARVYMFLWMLAALAALYVTARALFGVPQAIAALFLTLSFASLYGSGRTVVGEIPGFFFLMSALYLFFQKQRYYFAGLALGMAVVTKPSVFMLALPSLFIALAIERRDFFTKIFKTGAGMIAPALAWLFIVLRNPFSKTIWHSILTFYKNPYSSSLTENILRNLKAAPFSTTILYFSLLYIALFLARFLQQGKLRTLYDFVLAYCVFAFAYYLRSPGWLRYILIGELLVLFLMPSALTSLRAWVAERNAAKGLKRVLPEAIFIACILIAIQFAHLFIAADLYYSDSENRAAAYLNERYPDASVLVYDSAELGVQLRTPRRYSMIYLTGIPQIGTNPLLHGQFPDFIVTELGKDFYLEAEPIVEKNYVADSSFGKLRIFKKK